MATIQEQKRAVMTKAFCDALPEFKSFEDALDITLAGIAAVLYLLCACYMSIGIGYDRMDEWKSTCTRTESYCAAAHGFQYFIIYSTVTIVFILLVGAYVPFKNRINKEFEEIDRKFSQKPQEIKKETCESS